jgi:hypothetical protein
MSADEPQMLRDEYSGPTKILVLVCVNLVDPSTIRIPSKIYSLFALTMIDLATGFLGCLESDHVSLRNGLCGSGGSIYNKDTRQNVLSACTLKMIDPAIKHRMV